MDVDKKNTSVGGILLASELKGYISKRGIPPFRGKTACSDLNMYDNYLISYGIFEPEYGGEEYKRDCLKKYIHYLQHWCIEDEGAQEEIAKLQEKIGSRS